MKILMLVMPYGEKMGVTICTKLNKDYLRTALSVVIDGVFRVWLRMRNRLDLH